MGFGLAQDARREARIFGPPSLKLRRIFNLTDWGILIFSVVRQKTPDFRFATRFGGASPAGEKQLKVKSVKFKVVEPRHPDAPMGRDLRYAPRSGSSLRFEVGGLF